MLVGNTFDLFDDSRGVEVAGEATSNGVVLRVGGDDCCSFS